MPGAGGILAPHPAGSGFQDRFNFLQKQLFVAGLGDESGHINSVKEGPQVGPGGQNEDRGRRLGAGLDALQEAHAAHAGHTDIQNHEVGRASLQFAEGLFAAAGQFDPVAMVREKIPHGHAQMTLVIDEQD